MNPIKQQNDLKISFEKKSICFRTFKETSVGEKEDRDRHRRWSLSLKWVSLE